MVEGSDQRSGGRSDRDSDRGPASRSAGRMGRQPWVIRVVIGVLLAGAVVAALVFFNSGGPRVSLAITYGANGIEQLSYKGIGLEDISQNPTDAFHIWHMKATDLRGNLLSNGQYGWGEINNGRSWNAATHTWTYTFDWGSISVGFVQDGDTLNMAVTTTNAANSGIIFDGATVYPFVLHFPQLPVGFGTATTPQLSLNTTGPSALAADYTEGEVASVVPDARQPLYSGFWPASQADAYTPMISTTSPDGLAVFLPPNDRPLQPGQSDTARVSLRFAPSGTSMSLVAADIYKIWAAAWPPQVQWADRRIVGTVYLASSPQGNPTQPGGYPNNPRRYFNDSSAKDFDVTTAAGLVAFQTRLLKQAAANVANMQRLHAQGAITWDIEGEQFAQPTSYACAPDQIAALAPEMESVISAEASPYHGMKLDDAYFKTMRDAGFKVGVCVRPQHLELSGRGSASQVYLSNAAVEAEMLRKMRYAHDRWGATLFYVDSSVETNGAVLSSDIFKNLEAALPDSLIIPEESTAKHYAYGAPFLSFLDHTDTGTPATIRSYYPQAFSLNLINDVNPGKLAQYTAQLTQSVRRGDVLMVHADYWQANHPAVVEIYQAAASGK